MNVERLKKLKENRMSKNVDIIHTKFTKLQLICFNNSVYTYINIHLQIEKKKKN